MIDRHRTAQMLMEHEGVRLHPYEDSVGVLTIGIGRNLEDRGISRSEALFLMENDISEVVDLIEKLHLCDGLNDVRCSVLVDMIFNLGLSRFRLFKRMISALGEEDYAAAAAEMLDSRWAKQVGRRAKRLARMMETGQWVELSEV